VLAKAVPAWRQAHATIEGALRKADAEPDRLRQSLRALA
jgi:hypothetical protein